jgi:hypothetical protein
MTIELSCHQESGRAVVYIDGWMEGDPGEISRLFGGMIELPDLDARLQGSVLIPRAASGATRCELRGSGSITVEGRALDAGDRVLIRTGGEILWNR